MSAATNRPVSTVLYAEELVRRIRTNEPDAFDELYARYSPRVFGYLYQRLNGNHEEAEDLTAEVFTKVYEKIDSYQVQGAPLSSWLFRIAHNRLIDSVRRRPRQTRLASIWRPRCQRARSSRAWSRRSRSSRSGSAWPA
jgi:RNA polymerase sigma-70 factor (ECF subfamily)